MRVNASIGGEHPTVFYTEGNFKEYIVELMIPPKIEGNKMFCVAEVKPKF